MTGTLYIERGGSDAVRDDKERAYDTYLAASARAGDRGALSRLVQRWQPRLLGHAYRLTGEGELAAEAAQEAWLQILSGIARLDDAAAFPAWAMRIATRRCARLIRSRQRHRETRTALAREPDTGPEASDTDRRHSDLAAVQRALAGLPGEQRAAIGLFYLEEMSIAEVAVALDVPPGTVKTRLMHARRKLRAQLVGGDDEQA